MKKFYGAFLKVERFIASHKAAQNHIVFYKCLERILTMSLIFYIYQNHIVFHKCLERISTMSLILNQHKDSKSRCTAERLNPLQVEFFLFIFLQSQDDSFRFTKQHYISKKYLKRIITMCL